MPSSARQTAWQVWDRAVLTAQSFTQIVHVQFKWLMYKMIWAQSITGKGKEDVSKEKSFIFSNNNWIVLQFWCKGLCTWSKSSSGLNMKWNGKNWAVKFARQKLSFSSWATKTWIKNIEGLFFCQGLFNLLSTVLNWGVKFYTCWQSVISPEASRMLWILDLFNLQGNSKQRWWKRL